MRNYFKRCKTIKGVDFFLKQVGLEHMAFMFELPSGTEIDIDAWDDDFEQTGSSVQVWVDDEGYDVRISRYTIKDIEKLNLI